MAKDASLRPTMYELARELGDLATAMSSDALRIAV
jgi:hypothetical protein